jgi:hypothetical protein
MRDDMGRRESGISGPAGRALCRRKKIH